MSSIGSILNAAKQAINATQAGVSTASHNIANAQTEGYTRQRLVLTASASGSAARGKVSAGVTIAGTDRPRSVLLDNSFRRESAKKEEFELRKDALLRVEASMAEMTEASVTNALEGFFSAWSDLATTPIGGSQRELVRQSASVVIERLNGAAERIRLTRDSVISSLEQDTGIMNDMLREVARLNREILGAEAGGRIAPDLRDSRDLVLDRLSNMFGLRSMEGSDGMVTVLSSSGALVSGTTPSQLDVVVNTSGEFGFQFQGTSTFLKIRGGRLGSQLDLINERIPAVQSQMDQAVEALVTEVNALHTTGTASDGTTGVPFFDPAGLTASTIRLSTTVQANAQYIMTGTSGASGDGALAMDIARLRFTPVTSLGGKSIKDAYIESAVSLGLQVQTAEHTVAAQEALLSQLDQHRSAVNDVSTDEELMTLSRFQQAYIAATKVFRTADEMMETLMNLK